MSEVPLHLLRAIGHYEEEKELWRIVTRLELYGVRVQVWRLQLGDPAKPGFGDRKLLYQSRDKLRDEDANG
jgi:hypothetical protein